MLGHPFGTVAGDGVADFVAEDDGESVFILSDGKDAGVDSDFAAGKAEGVHLIRLNKIEFPLKAGVVDYFFETFANAFDEVDLRA